jgi:arylsulfatase A-like enzyme
MSSRDTGRRSATKDSALSRRNILLGGTTIAAASALAAPGSVKMAQAQPQAPVTTAGRRPNILVIFGDDVGLTNVSAYSLGVMGYRTPNIDRIAREGMMFTDYYAEQSCTAGRSSFLTGQATLRTGLSKVGLPAANLGLRFEDITIAEALKPLGYATGQFGKNHLGDRNEFLPTVHGFDEFFGNLYHLNAEEEPEHPDYPKDPRFRAKYGPRGVLKSVATTTDDATVDPRFGKVGKQKIEDTGSLTKKRMETIDDETAGAAVDFMQRQVRANKPFFCWWNGTRMHAITHVRPENQGKSGISTYVDGMLEHDGHVGQLLKALDDLGIANDTIVVYTTDNGPHMNTWPDGAMTPFRGEKNTNWEGAFRVPAMVRWPGRIRAGSVSNDIVAALDWFPTLLAVAGDTGVKDRLLTGWDVGGRTYKLHLDGYNQLPYLTGQQDKSARKEFFYFSDDGQLMSVRYENWKQIFCEQRVEGTLQVWAEPFVCQRLPKLINLRMDPFERAPITSNTYYDWQFRHAFLVVPTQEIVGQFMATFKEFPPRQKPSSFSVEQVMDLLGQPEGSSGTGTRAIQ